MKALTGVIALMLALLLGASNVVFAAEKATTPAVPAAQKKADKASPELMMTGKVTQVGGNSFTIVAKGRQRTFVANNFKTLPKVGEIVDVTYTGTPGGPMHATSVKSSKSNSSD
ncbi:MAG: hypothetical protein A2150_00825 [Candidatus Muproteobacteria bacterium RBG_16_64_11]|uniref:DUF5666 domain-containing protein n=1 Tax=Candidatus Muproteobacteria bacterium RBG_16_64_11 TaxID=1817758 RepID=A0A1F6TIK3_9PROT|nr:MAG: hypothetical protein A2150_00825 [Candidatus Muproteobacteria bacterium RBG_16_64_11]